MLTMAVYDFLKGQPTLNVRVAGRIPDPGALCSDFSLCQFCFSKKEVSGLSSQTELFV